MGSNMTQLAETNRMVWLRYIKLYPYLLTNGLFGQRIEFNIKTDKFPSAAQKSEVFLLRTSRNFTCLLLEVHKIFNGIKKFLEKII